jgi:hypothetical protein
MQYNVVPLSYPSGRSTPTLLSRFSSSTIVLLCALVLMHTTSIKDLTWIHFFLVLRSQIVLAMRFLKSLPAWVCLGLPVAGPKKRTLGALGAKKSTVLR